MIDLADDVVDTVREPLLILHADLRVLRANRAFFRAFHVTEKETVGAHLLDLGNGQWRATRLQQLLETVITRNESFDDFEVEHVFPHVGRKIMVLNARRITRDDGDLVLLAFEDMTARRAVEHELQRSNAELERFAYVASHDLQEPLRMVSSYVQLLDRKYRGQLDEQADKYIHYAVDGAQRMQMMIRGLLAYSRLSRESAAFQDVDCELILSEVIKNLEPAQQQANARITHDPLPLVRGDPTQLLQLFQNLIANSIKFRSDEPPRIHVGCKSNRGELHFSVADNGIGIEPQYFDRIFILFQRLHTRWEYEGAGLGLALCQKIVERHGGKLTVESRTGVGSTFHFTMPAPEMAGHG